MKFYISGSRISLKGGLRVKHKNGKHSYLFLNEKTSSLCSIEKKKCVFDIPIRHWQVVRFRFSIPQNLIDSIGFKDIAARPHN
jgi:hypothetical protein